MSSVRVTNRKIVAAAVAVGLIAAALPRAADPAYGAAAGDDNALHTTAGPSVDPIASMVPEASRLAQVADWLERASGTYQTEIIGPLSAAGDEIGMMRKLNDATRRATRWVMWWVSMGARVYAHSTAPKQPSPAHDHQMFKASAESQRVPTTTEDVVVGGVGDKAGEKSETQLASSEAEKANAAEKARADAALKEREAKAALEKWKAENDKKIAEGLKKLEEFEKADKARKAEEARKAAEALRAERARKAEEAKKRADVQKEAEKLRAAYRAERAAAEAKRLAEEKAAVERARALEASRAEEEANRKAAAQKMVEDAEKNAAAALDAAKNKLALENELKPPSAAAAAAIPYVAKEQNKASSAQQVATAEERAAAPAAKPRKPKKETASPRARKQKRPRYSTPRYYTVVRGDTLSKIALRFYGRSDAIRHIRRANRGKIRNQDLIFPGMRLKINGRNR